MAISNTAIGKRIPRKMDEYIVDTIFAAKNNEKWRAAAQIISGSRRKYSAVNLKRLEYEASDEDIIAVPGKVLGSGNIKKKLKICALYFSASALHKIKQANGDAILLIDEIKKNPNAEKVKLLR